MFKRYSRLTVLRFSLLSIISSLASTSFGQSPVNAEAVNAVLNPTFFAGADIGAQINSAWASGIGKTVRVPAGIYKFSTTIKHPGAGYTLICDSGAVLMYGGGENAIELPSAPLVATGVSGIDGEGGCLLQGTTTGKSGVHINPSNSTFVRNIRIEQFTSGYGIYVTGGNTVSISGSQITYNKEGIFLTGSSYGTGYAANAIRIFDSDISSNSEWGIDSENSHTPATKNLGNRIFGNLIRNNGLGGIELNWDQSTTIESNFFQNVPINLGIGNGSDNVYAVSVLHNYFSSSASDLESISLGYGIGFSFNDNTELGTSSTGCFVNETYGSQGSVSAVRGVLLNFITSSTSHEFCKHGTPTSSP